MPKALPSVVSEKEFRKAVAALRKKEKKNTRERDKISALRRRLPMMEVKNDYVFQTEDGPKTFHDLFEGRKQLIVYHFMYHPTTDKFCVGCSFVADHIPHLAHINARNTSFTMVSHAPLKSMKRHKKRLEWDLPWASSWENTFNQDLGRKFPSRIQRLHPRRQKDLSHLFHRSARGRVSRNPLRSTRHHTLGPTREKGRLTKGLATNRPVLMVAFPRRLRKLTETSQPTQVRVLSEAKVWKRLQMDVV